MNRTTKRILIANDIIQAIKAQHFIPVTNKVMGDCTRDLLYTARGGEALQCLVQDPQNKCEVCANGAILLAYISRFNSVKSVLGVYHNNLLEKVPQLAEVFTKKELDELEYLFEGNEYLWHEGWMTDEIMKMAAFRRKSHLGSNNLLIDMMQQLIDNDGENIVL